MCALSDLEGWRSLVSLEVALFWALEIWEDVHVTLAVGCSFPGLHWTAAALSAGLPQSVTIPQQTSIQTRRSAS